MNQNITRSDIFNFWKDKKITQEGELVHIREEVKGPCSIPVIDWGEPSCFNCGKPILVEHEAEYDKWLENGDFEAIWNSHTMQKETKILGLLDKKSLTLENFFIVCPECYEKLTSFIKKNVQKNY